MMSFSISSGSNCKSKEKVNKHIIKVEIHALTAFDEFLQFIFYVTMYYILKQTISDYKAIKNKSKQF